MSDSFNKYLSLRLYMELAVITINLVDPPQMSNKSKKNSPKKIYFATEKIYSFKDWMENYSFFDLFFIYFHGSAAATAWQELKDNGN